MLVFRYFLPEPAFLTFQRNITLRNHQRATLPPVPVYHRSQSQQGQQTQSQYGVHYRHHVYQSIPDNHIYHTLEPSDLVGTLKGARMVAPPVAVPSHVRAASSPFHSYSHSTSSGQQLIPIPSVSSSIATVTVKNKDIPEEYIV